MAVKQTLVQRQVQSLALTPAMRTSLAVLRMNDAELQDMAMAEAAVNPFLLCDPPRAAAPPPGVADLAAARLVARPQSLQASLSHQIGMMALDARVAAMARLLIAELREDGFLDTPLDELAEVWQQPLSLLETALTALQGCEPAGVGARDLRECLTLQLIDAGLTPEAAADTIAHLSLFADGDWPTIGRHLGLSPKAARARATLLRRLSPRPVGPSSADQPVAALPDLVLERLADGSLRVGPYRDHPAGLRLDEALVARALSDGFAEDLLRRARAVMAAVAQRGRTLARIGDWLVQNQTGFLLHGPAALRPVTRAELARDLGLHASTVGRAIAGKHVDIDGRLWPLSRLFSTAIPGAEGMVAAFTLQQRIAGMIGQEAATAPLSDEAIARALRAEGVDIARRTVAKYRQVLRIPGSAARRRLSRLRGAGSGQNDRPDVHAQTLR